MEVLANQIESWIQALKNEPEQLKKLRHMLDTKSEKLAEMIKEQTDD